MKRYLLALLLLAALLALFTIRGHAEAPWPTRVGDCSVVLTTAGTAYTVPITGPRGNLQFSNSDTTHPGNIFTSPTNTAPAAGGMGVDLIQLAGSWSPPANTAGAYTIYAAGTVNGQVLTCHNYP
jgi:hypothetical protein